MSLLLRVDAIDRDGRPFSDGVDLSDSDDELKKLWISELINKLITSVFRGKIKPPIDAFLVLIKEGKETKIELNAYLDEIAKEPYLTANVVRWRPVWSDISDLVNRKLNESQT